MTTHSSILFSFFLVLPVYSYQPISLHAQSCNPMDCIPPGFSVHALFQARILEWVAISFSPLQYSCLEHPMDGEAWRATDRGVAKVRHDLSNLAHIHYPY